MIDFEEALNKVKTHTTTSSIFEINLNNSVGYYLAKDIISPIDLPLFRQAAMDGYALCVHNSSSYKVIGEIKAGDKNNPALSSGQAVRIFTGAAVPRTANTVIMQEKVSVLNNEIKIEEIVNENTNIRDVGEQVKKGSIALPKGTKLTAAAIGFLASLGILTVFVYKKPSIAIITTGNELISPGNTLSYGSIYDSNTIMLKSALISLGFYKIDTYTVDDNLKNTRELFEKIISNTDIVLISGGISVGDYDFVKKALIDLEVSEIFYKVRQKPGKPLFFGKKKSSLIFALPGNPAAALTCFYIYVYTALQIASGKPHYILKKETKKITSDYFKKGNRTQFLKAVTNGDEVTVLDGQSSAMLQTFAVANAFIIIKHDVYQIKKGNLVEVVRVPNL